MRALRRFGTAASAVALLVASTSATGGAADLRDASRPAHRPATDPRMDVFPEAQSGSGRCGTYLVEWSTPTAAGDATLTVRDEHGSPVVDVHERVEACCERITPFWCGDALDDRGVILSYGYYSGGAHCCTTMHVVDLRGQRTLLKTELGNYTDALVPAQLDDGPSLELFGLSDVFAYFGDLSFAGSPWLPVVFAYRNGSYREMTRDYEEIVRSDLALALAELSAVLESPVYPADPPALALQAFGDYVLLGEADAGLRRLEDALSTRPDVAAWLVAHADEAQRLVAQRYEGVG